MRKRQEMGLNQLRTKRSGVRVPPGAPAASCRSQVANLTLWGSRFLLPAFFIDIYFITLTHVAANPCGSPHFSAQNAASPFGLVSPAGSVGAERSPPGSSTAPLREKSRCACTVRLQARSRRSGLLPTFCGFSHFSATRNRQGPTPCLFLFLLTFAA